MSNIHRYVPLCSRPVWYPRRTAGTSGYVLVRRSERARGPRAGTRRPAYRHPTGESDRSSPAVPDRRDGNDAGGSTHDRRGCRGRFDTARPNPRVRRERVEIGCQQPTAEALSLTHKFAASKQAFQALSGAILDLEDRAEKRFSGERGGGDG